VCVVLYCDVFCCDVCVVMLMMMSVVLGCGGRGEML